MKVQKDAEAGDEGRKVEPKGIASIRIHIVLGPQISVNHPPPAGSKDGTAKC